MILNLRNIISEDSEMNNKMATSFKTIKRWSFCFLYRCGRKVKKKSIILYKSLILEEITNKYGGRCLEEASYTLNDVTFCASQIFCKEVASSPNSHRSKMLWRFSIFTVLVKIHNLQQIFKIVKMLVKMLYLHWVEGTPQPCPFPSVLFPSWPWVSYSCMHLDLFALASLYPMTLYYDSVYKDPPFY